MKKILLSSLMLLALTVFPQQWCVPGATWNFTFSATNTVTGNYGSSEIRYAGDQTVDGILCKRMRYTRNSKNFGNVTLPVELRDYYTYVNNGVILYRYDVQQFDTLVNFNFRPGKSWIMTAYKPETCNDPFVTVQYTVLDTGHVMINNVNLMYQKIAQGDSATAFSNTAAVTHTIYERMGDIYNYIFRYVWGCSVQTDLWPKEGNFTCYWDNTMGVYSKPGANCNYNPTGLSETQGPDALHIFPNPSSGLFTITGTLGTVRVYNASGALLKTVADENQSIELDLRAYPDGLYMVQFQSADKSGSYRLIKQ